MEGAQKQPVPLGSVASVFALGSSPAVNLDLLILDFFQESHQKDGRK
jgi:hypothetical protein